MTNRTVMMAAGVGWRTRKFLAGRDPLVESFTVDRLV
jgi:hypothetical protein